MKRLVLAASLVLASATAGLADSLFWVVGNRATNRCEIVTRNPVIDGDIWFADGPYRSLSDAKLARFTIGPCPNRQDPADN